MEPICIFQRIEKKYRLSRLQQQMLLGEIGGRLAPDVYGRSTVLSLYLDTPDHLLIRNSLDAEAYKEKLRLRSYGTPRADSAVFLELKKKYKGVVYKRRVSMPLRAAERYLETGEAPEDSQIMREIDYAMHFYRRPAPAMFIACEREAFTADGAPNLRLTFDENVRARDTALLLELGSAGTRLLPEQEILLEIKTDGAMPLWLSGALDRCRVRPASFSKYGAAYLRSLERGNLERKGEILHVCNF